MFNADSLKTPAAFTASVLDQSKKVVEANKKVVDFQMGQWSSAEKAASAQMKSVMDLSMTSLKSSVEMAFDMQKAALEAMAPKADA